MNLCMNCMQEMGNNSVCRFCGFDNKIMPKSDFGALSPNSLLQNRFTVGTVQYQDEYTFTYIAYDSQAGKRVTLREYYPQSVCFRETNSSVVALYPEYAENYHLGLDAFYAEANNAQMQIADIFLENNTAYQVYDNLDTSSAYEVPQPQYDTYASTAPQPESQERQYQPVAPQNIAAAKVKTEKNGINRLGIIVSILAIITAVLVITTVIVMLKQDKEPITNIPESLPVLNKAEMALSTPAPTPTPRPYRAPYFTGISASAVTPATKNVRNYQPEMAWDGNPATAWNVRGGTGEWIMMTAQQPQQIKGIKLLNGYTKYNAEYGMWLYYANHRPKNITVSFSDGTEQYFTLSDVFDEENYMYQTLDFGGIKETTYVKITIDSIYRGSKWDDCCISEIQTY